MSLFNNSNLVHRIIRTGEHSKTTASLFPALSEEQAKSKWDKNTVRWKINQNLCSNLSPGLIFLNKKTQPFPEIQSMAALPNHLT